MELVHDSLPCLSPITPIGSQENELKNSPEKEKLSVFRNIDSPGMNISELSMADLQLQRMVEQGNIPRK